MLGKGLESLIPPDKSGEPRDEVVNVGEPVQEASHEEPVESEQVEAEPKAGATPDGIVFQIEVTQIRPNPHQPRKHFDEDALRELAISIREFGVIQPLIVSKIENESEWGWSVHYELIAGERRLMSAKIAGLHTVPVIIRDEPSDREKLELAVIENIQRTDLNPVELARAIARLQDEFGLTQREIAVRLGKSRGSIANTVRILSLPTEIQDAIASGEISESHARLLLSIDNPSKQHSVFEEILDKGLNVRETDARIRQKDVHEEDIQSETTFIEHEIVSLKEKLEEFLGTKVSLQSKGNSGKITINFYSPEELEAIVDKLTRQNDSQSPSPPLEI